MGEKSFGNKEIILVVLLSLMGLGLWSTPITQVPFGEVDAAAHFSLGDYMSSADEAIVTLPYYLGVRYNRDNKLAPGKLWYLPHFHIFIALSQILGGERILPAFLFMALLASMMFATFYVVFRKLYGVIPAVLSTVLVMFSFRGISSYTMGLWPLLFGYALLPLTLYALYKYCDGFLESGKDKKDIKYLIITVILLTTTFVIHPQGWMHTMGAMFFFLLFLVIKEKKLPFDVKHAGIALVVFILLIAIFPLQTGNFFHQLFFEKTVGDYVGTPQQPGFSTFFKWFATPTYETGFPPRHFSFLANHGGWWLIPFILLGAALLLIRRRRKDLMMLGWGVSLYFFLHTDVFGTGRVAKSLIAEAQFLYPLATLGLVFLASVVYGVLKAGLPVQRSQVKLAFAAAFLVLILVFNVPPAYASLKNAYSGVNRLNPSQLQASEWVMHNLPETNQPYAVGTISQQKSRWMRVLSQHHIEFGGTGPSENASHILLDYTDYLVLGAQQQAQQLQQLEAQLQSQAQPVYNKQNIRVYPIVR